LGSRLHANQLVKGTVISRTPVELRN
jgi:hypothetical protein